MEKVDVVIPVYMAGEHLLELLDGILELELKAPYQVGQVVLVLDGKQALQDGLSIKQLFSIFNEKITIIELQKNYGQYTATYIGMLNTDADWVVTMDDDGQHDPVFIRNLLDERERTNADLVYAKYTKVNHKSYKVRGSSTLRSIMKWTHPESIDANSFRLIHKSILRNLSSNPVQSAFLDEDLWQASKAYAVVEVPHLTSQKKTSSYSKFKLFRQAINLIVFHTSLPLKWMTRMGIIMGVLFFLIGTYRVYLKWTQDVPLGYTSLIVSIFFSTSILLISLGIIGEYIRRIWIQQQGLNKVNYTIHDSKSAI